MPIMLTQMIETGEESGALDDMLDKVATFYDNEVNTTVDSLTSIQAVDHPVHGCVHRGHRDQLVPADVRLRQAAPVADA